MTEPTTVYSRTTTSISGNGIESLDISIFPNPATDLIAIQVGGLVTEQLFVKLIDLAGKVIKSTAIPKGSTIAYFDVQTIYNGAYLIKIANGLNSVTRKIVVQRE